MHNGEVSCVSLPKRWPSLTTGAPRRQRQAGARQRFRCVPAQAASLLTRPQPAQTAHTYLTECVWSALLGKRPSSGASSHLESATNHPRVETKSTAAAAVAGTEDEDMEKDEVPDHHLHHSSELPARCPLLAAGRHHLSSAQLNSDQARQGQTRP
jgi:hypothetical protein